ncbi:MAG: outer membrane beta-barrel protein [Acidobacteria bacterium]|nr:outer membrane beta-barrel protein [Acidobacteriota bacterium]
MARYIAVLTTAVLLLGPATAVAQEQAGAGRFEVNAAPAGGMFFTKGENDSETDFGNYALGASATYNINHLFALEGEIGSGIGVRQELNISGNAFSNTKSPNTLAYNGNLVYTPGGNDRSVVPYLTGGMGGLTLFEREELASLGLAKNETFFTANMGAGAKWFSSRYWGLRGDYRLFWVNGKDDAPTFFGLTGDRYGHRFYGSILFTFGR